MCACKSEDKNVCMLYGDMKGICVIVICVCEKE